MHPTNNSSVRALLEHALAELCDELAADAGLITSADPPFEVWAQCQRRRITQRSIHHDEWIRNPDGDPVGRVRVHWNGRRSVRRSSSQAVRAVASSFAELCTLLAAPEEPPGWAFDGAPVALWAHDLSALERWAADRRQEGVTDFTQYFTLVPGASLDAARRLNLLAANQEAQRFHPRWSKDSGDGVFDLLGSAEPAVWAGFVDALLAKSAVVELVLPTSSVDSITLEFCASIDSAGRADYSRVVTYMHDGAHTSVCHPADTGLSNRRTSFLAAMSHELRTPLTAVVGFAELLLEDLDFEECERVEMTRTIYQQAITAGAIVQDMMVIAQGEGAQLAIESRLISLRAVIERVLTSLDDGGRTVVLGPDATIEGDAVRLTQVLRNLLTNAMRHGGERRGVEIVPGEASVTLAIWDDGPEISADIQRSMFDLFVSGHLDVSTPAGIGLGLTVSKRLADAMGGGLGYRHDGTTSRFELQLPHRHRSHDSHLRSA